jgi:hypothetical protein
LIGGAFSLVALAVLLKYESRMSARDGFVGVLASFAGALLIEYLSLPLTVIYSKPENVVDILTFGVLRISSTLVFLGYGFAMFAIWRLVQGVFRPLQGSPTPTADGDASDAGAARLRSERSSIKSQVLAPLGAYFGSTEQPRAALVRPSFGDALAVSVIRALILPIFVAAIVPGAFSAYLLRREEWGVGLAIGIPWIVCFAVLALVCHKRHLIHIAVSAGCAVALLAGSVLLYR